METTRQFSVTRRIIEHTREPVVKTVKCKLWKFDFPQFEYNELNGAVTRRASITVAARTKSEARAIAKGQFGVIPKHTKIRAVGEANVQMQTRVNKFRYERAA